MNKRQGMAASLVAAVMLIAARNSLATPRSIASQAPAVSRKAGNPLVTPVVGESWLDHLNRRFGDTNMGKTWDLGPPPATAEEDLPGEGAASLVSCTTQTVSLRGADLYRLNCRGCHGEVGLGAPPEITSVVDPVRATSVQLVRERMKKVGMDVSLAQATQLAQQAQAALVQRLHRGGKNMPPFPQLQEAEVQSILAYLRQLAGIPGAEKEQRAVTESPLRVGELIVKSTCHICHSAAGSNPSPVQILNGAIPPLQVLTSRTDQSGLVRKVTQGAPILMGKPAMLFRGRMPVLRYLTSNEVADVYLYLVLYPPPSELEILKPVATNSQPNETSAPIDLVMPVAGTGAELNKNWTENPSLSNQANSQLLALFVGLALLAAGLAAGGLTFTLWEFKRRSSRNDDCFRLPASPIWTGARPLVVARQRSCRACSEASKGRHAGKLTTVEIRDWTIDSRKGGRPCHSARSGQHLISF
jgi:mono/diheme cytochrome c family protein